MTNEKIYVHSYTRGDGTKVKDYYRNNPAGSDPNGNSGGFGTVDENSFGNTNSFSGNSDFPQFPKTQEQPEQNPDLQPAPVTLNGFVEYNNELQPYSNIKPSPENSGLYNELIKSTQPESQKLQFDENTASDNVNSAIDIAKYITNFNVKNNPNLKENLAEKFSNAVGKVKEVFNKARNIEQNLLNKLTNAKDQTEYSQNYQDYIKIKQSNNKQNDALKRVDYYNQIGEYSLAAEELEKFKADFDTVVDFTRKNRPIQQTPPEQNPGNVEKWMHKPVTTLNASIIRNAGKITNNKDYQKLGDDIDKYVMPQEYEKPLSMGSAIAAKPLIDVGMGIYNLAGATDANAMWQAASYDFGFSKDYVKKNGSLVYGINNLPSKELQNIVRNKLKGQLNTDDALGIIYHSKSDLAKQIANSPEIKNKFQNFKGDLLSGKVIKGESDKLRSNQNLGLSLGNSDFVYMFIDKDKSLCTVTLDTYDFNAHDPDWKVQVARVVQDKGLIRNYYSLIISRTPQKVWIKW